MAGLDNRAKGELRCVVQNDDPPSDDSRHRLLAPSPPAVAQEHKDVDQHSYTASQPRNFLPPIQCQNREDGYSHSKGLPSFGSQSTFETGHQSSAISPLSYGESVNYNNDVANVTPEQDEARPRDHLAQLEMKYPSSEIWQPLARGERRRRNAICSFDPLPQNSSTIHNPEPNQESPWAQIARGPGAAQSQTNAMDYFQPLDFTDLAGAFDLAHLPWTAFEYGDTNNALGLAGGNAFNAQAFNPETEPDVLEANDEDTYDTQDLKSEMRNEGDDSESRDSYHELDFDECHCEYHAATTAVSSQSELLNRPGGRQMKPLLHRRHSA